MKKLNYFINKCKYSLWNYKFLAFIMLLLIGYHIVIGKMVTIPVWNLGAFLGDYYVGLKLFLFILVNIIIYRLLYYWRNLKCSFWSFICFFFNMLLIILMFGVLLKLFKGINQPIFIENLSHLSTIRHSLFVIFCILGCIFIFIKNKSVYLQNLYEKLTYPYLLQESKRLLETWETFFFGCFFESLLYLIAFNKVKCFLILSLHFFFYYLIPIMQALLFINFAFFHGDLRLNLYLVPLSLLTVCFKHLWYYFNRFLEQNTQAIKEVLIVQYEDDSIFQHDHQFATINPAKLSFRLSTPHSDSAETAVFLAEYKKYFILLGRAHVHLYYYKKSTRVLSYLIIFLRFISCCNIMFFFNTNPTAFSSLTVSSLFTKVFPKVTHVTRNYASESFLIKKANQKALEELAKGAYKAGHPVTTDLDEASPDNKVPFLHQPTHGPGLPSNPSKPLSSSEDLEGTSRPQHAVYPKENFDFDLSWVGKKIPYSKRFYEKEEVKQNNTKNKDLQTKKPEDHET